MKATLKKMIGVSETVEDLEARISQLNSEGVSLADTIADAEQVSATAEDEKQLLSAMAKAQAARNRQRRIDQELNELRRRLLIARNDARTKELARLRSAYQQAATAFLADARRTMAVAKKAIEAREAIMLAGFRAECAALPVMPMVGPAPLLADDLLDLFAFNLTRAFEAPMPPKVTQIAPPRSRAETEAELKQRELNRRYFDAARDRAALSVTNAPKTVRPLYNEPAAPGQHLVQFIRSDVPLPRDLGFSLPGDRVNVDEFTAQALLRNAAVDLPRKPSGNRPAGHVPNATSEPVTSFADAAPASETGGARALYAEQRRPNERLVFMLRAGVPLPRELGPSLIGDVVSMDLTTASELLRAGAADFHKQESPSNDQPALALEASAGAEMPPAEQPVAAGDHA
ncbi:UNVERIFIED_ORG: hypothetical protein M2348_000697 [Sphingomonas sp. R1F5B]